MTQSFIKLSGVIMAEEPLHIGSGRRTGVIKHSYPYIPGSFMRGAVGTSLVKLLCELDEPLIDHEGCPHYDECRYVKMFGEGTNKSSNIFFRYAYPLHLKCGGVYRPAPMTLYKCESSQCGKTYDALTPPARCDACPGRVKPYQGYICDECGEFCAEPIRLMRVTSTAIDRKTDAAASVPGPEGAAGTLHVTEAIPTGSRFRFEAVVSSKLEEEVDALKAVLERGLPDEGVGGSRSRGFGKASIRELEVEMVTVDALERRAEEIDSSSFSVVTCSPLILNGALDSSSLLEGARRAYSWAFREGKPKLPEVYLEASRLSVEPYGGWSLKTGRRRRMLQAISSGSVSQFRCDEGDLLLSKALAALEIYPLGDYKPHGCGQLRIDKSR